jgi:hypothetical protein
MPPPFQRLSVPQFAGVLQAFSFKRKVTAIHMHHTWRPDHRQWRGVASMEGMWRFHTQERGFSDIAQHLTIDPEGFVWTGRSWNAAPASAVGHNGNGVAGPFMFEVVGNFDRGGDTFAGAQRHAVLDVIALVNRRFGLDAGTLLFHNQVSAKTCPGNSIDHDAFVAEVRAHVPSTDTAPLAANGSRSAASRSAVKSRAGKDVSMPLPPSAFADADVVKRTLALLEGADAGSRAADAASTPMEELDYSHDTGREASGADSRGLFGGGLDAAAIDALRPYVVNLRQGQFSGEGHMRMSAADVDALLFEHAWAAAKEAVANGRPFKLLLYAHGGLVNESDGLQTARAHVGWWRDNGVYPVHFVWETGLFDTLRDLIVRSRRGPEGSRGFFTDRIFDPLLEAGVRALGGRRVWFSMKSSAEAASGPGGGAAYFVGRLLEFCKRFAKDFGPQGGSLELHAAGHSAGSIFLAHLLQAAAQAKGLPNWQTLQLMAPAIRADAFAALTQPLVGNKLQTLTVYTMRRDLERDDHCAHLYRKSLLYLVSAACESERDAAILGLEDSLRGDARLSAFFGLGGRPAGVAEIVWSTSPRSEGRNATRAIAHGDFDNDAPTMESIARRVLGIDDTMPLTRRFADGQSRSGRDPWNSGPDWPEEFNDVLASKGPIAPSGPVPAAAVPTPVAVTAAAEGGPPGRRRALCVGIDTYDQAPLQGCVNDARLWGETLGALGFEVQSLFNEQARREPLFAAMRALVAEARAGDEVVFQFAGHGTQAKDDNGDEDAGDSRGLDEALCPHDFSGGPLIIDDEIGALLDQVAAGVRVTFFMDCCHSGSNTRAAPVPGARARRVLLTPAQQERYLAWRRSSAGSRSAPPLRRESRDPVEVAFAACQSKELAWESGGHGEFTLHATRRLREGGATLAPDAFYAQVLQDFGPARRQTPQLTAPPDRLAQRLFRT